MFKSVINGIGILALMTGMAFAEPVKFRVKTRLDHLQGTPNVLVISTIPSEITSITCESWKMLGIGSWHDQNNFTIPAADQPGVSLAILNANKFDGYCNTVGSIVAHTDDGDFIGVLDAGPGNWNGSTKLTFSAK